jgi:hypothetical protein
MDWCCKLGAGRWGDCGHHRLISVRTRVLDSYIDFILFSHLLPKREEPSPANALCSLQAVLVFLAAGAPTAEGKLLLVRGAVHCMLPTGVCMK